MKDKPQTAKNAEQCQSAKLPTKPQAIDQAALVAALDKLFTSGGWEIPDDCVTGLFKHKVDQLQARVDNLTHSLAVLTEQVNGKPVTASGRVDALASAKARKS